MYQIPDFEGLVVGPGKNGVAVWGEGHRGDTTAVSILLLDLELQSAYTQHKKLRRRSGGEGSAVSYLHPRL